MCSKKHVSQFQLKVSIKEIAKYTLGLKYYLAGSSPNVCHSMHSLEPAIDMLVPSNYPDVNWVLVLIRCGVHAF